MSFDITQLLLHSDEVPSLAKSALTAARATPPGAGRQALLKTAALELYNATSLECGEALELVGLPEDSCG